MLRKILALIAALVLLISYLPYSYGGDPGTTGAIVRDRERYYHRLKDMRAKDPQNAELSYRIGNLYYSMQMEDEAIKEYRRTLKVNPEHQYAKWFLSKVLVSKGYFEEAFWLVRELIDKHRENPDLYASAGEILLKMDQTDAAREYFNRFDELKYAEKDGAKPVKTLSQPTAGQWKKFFY